MKPKPDFTVPSSTRSFALPIATTLFAAVIFAVDTLTASEIAASVLYIAVVLLSARFCDRRGLIAVCGACVALTLFSYLLTGGTKQTPVALINTIITVSIIALGGYLVLKIESAKSETRAFAEAQQLREALIGSVSHELRTPLASVLGGISILAETPLVKKDAHLAPLVGGIREEAVRLNSDIQNLLDATRIASHGLRSRQDWTDPGDIINSAVGRISPRYPEHRFELNLADGEALIHVDPVLVEQALGQIISNAAKFSPPQSTIRIAARAEAGEFIISVTDQGAGLNAEERAHFAERFFRGTRHAGKISGSGLGLWIAKTFVTSSAGKLDAQSPGEGLGTTVRIVFPITAGFDDLQIAAQDV